MTKWGYKYTMIEDLYEYIQAGDTASIKQIMEEYDLYVEDGKIFIRDKDDAQEKSDYWDNMSLIKKIGLNSLYGAVTNAASNFFDTRMGQSCTLSGRCTTRHMASKINEILTGKYEIGEVITYGDTDSNYFTVPETIKKDLTKEQFIEISDEIGKTVNKSFAEFYKQTFNVPEVQSAVIKCAREICATSALFIKKKRYAAMVYDEKNFRYDTEGKLGKLKIMGLDIKRADCPVWVQDKLKDTLNEILGKNKKSDNIVEHVREWRNEFMESDPWKMGIPKRVNKLTYYTKVFNQNTKGITIPGHVRASINWNNIIENEHDINSIKITDGFKVIVCKVHPNVYGIDSVAYPIDQGHLPQWFKELPFDKEGMVEVAIDKKVKNIFGILDIDLDLTKINDEEGILEWE